MKSAEHIDILCYQILTEYRGYLTGQRLFQNGYSIGGIIVRDQCRYDDVRIYYCIHCLPLGRPDRGYLSIDLILRETFREPLFHKFPYFHETPQ